MKNAATRLNEASEVTIPLRNLISMIAFQDTVARVHDLETEIARIKLLLETK